MAQELWYYYAPLFPEEPRCNQQGDVGYPPGTRLRTLSTVGFRPGLTSKPVYFGTCGQDMR